MVFVKCIFTSVLLLNYSILMSRSNLICDIIGHSCIGREFVCPSPEQNQNCNGPTKRLKPIGFCDCCRTCMDIKFVNQTCEKATEECDDELICILGICMEDEIFG